MSRAWPERAGSPARSWLRSRGPLSPLAAMGRPGRSGVLKARWPIGAEIVVVDGHLVSAHSLVAPTADLLVRVLQGHTDGAGSSGGLPGGLAERLRVEAMVDTVREIAASRTAPSWRTHPVPPDVRADLRLSVTDVLAEIRRRIRVLDALAPVVGADEPVVRARTLGDGPVRVGREQWRVLAALETATTPRKLAYAVGDSVFAMTCRVAELLQTGLVVAAAPGSAGRIPATLFLDAASRTAP